MATEIFAFYAILMMKNLPQMCVKGKLCHAKGKPQMPDKGQFRKRAGSAHGWYWICDVCAAKEGRHQRKPMTFIERCAVSVLAKSGYHFEPQFKIEQLVYDFAVQKLGLIIEMDGRRWHPEGNWEDKHKTKVAERNGWTVVRIRSGPDISGRVQAALDLRAEEVRRQNRPKNPCPDPDQI